MLECHVIDLARTKQRQCLDHAQITRDSQCRQRTLTRDYVRYMTSNGLMLSAKFEREFNVRNRADGRSFWIRAIYAF